MADLSALYKEDGLQGIIPYAFGMDGNGYRFLCQKLKEGVHLFILAQADIPIPFYFIENDKVYFSLYSSSVLADKKSDELAMEKHYTSAYELTLDNWNSSIWKRYRDLGVTHIRLDDSIWVNIKDVAPVANYEGVLNAETPLRNPTFNSALYVVLQETAADSCGDALIAYLWETLVNTTFYAPLHIAKQLQPGEKVNASNSDFHFLDMEDGTKALLLFTDVEFKFLYGQAFNVPQEDLQIVYTPDWNDVKAYMAENPGIGILINAGMGSFYLNKEILEQLELAALTESAASTVSNPVQVIFERTSDDSDPNKF